MNQKYLIYGAVALLVLMGLAIRFGCRHSPQVPGGDSREARLAQIDAMRQRQFFSDVEQLAELTTHADPAVGRAAIFALAEFEQPTAHSTLVELLGEEQPARVRAASAEVLGQSGREIQRLITLLAESRDAEVRLGAARGLASWSTPDRREALPAFVAALEDSDPKVRKVAVRGIHAASYKRFLFEPDKPPDLQKGRIDFIKRRLKELSLLE